MQTASVSLSLEVNFKFIINVKQNYLFEFLDHFKSASVLSVASKLSMYYRDVW